MATALVYPATDSLYPVLSAALYSVFTEWTGDSWSVNTVWLMTSEVGTELIHHMIPVSCAREAGDTAHRYQVQFMNVLYGL